MKKFIIVMMLITNCGGTKVYVTGNDYYKGSGKEYTYKGCSREKEKTEVERSILEEGGIVMVIIVLSPYLLAYFATLAIINYDDFPYGGGLVVNKLKTQLTDNDCKKKIIRVGE